MKSPTFLYIEEPENFDSSAVFWYSPVSGTEASEKFDSPIEFINFYKKSILGENGKKIKIKNSEIIITLPGTYTTYTSVFVPSKNFVDTSGAIPFLVEDFLADDIDSVIISRGEKISDGSIKVAITKKNTIEKILSFFNENEIKINCITSLVDLINSEKNDINILFCNGELFIKSERVCLQISESSFDLIKDGLFEIEYERSKIFLQEKNKNSIKLANQLKINFELTGKCDVEIKNYSGNLLEFAASNPSFDHINFLHDLRKNSGRWPLDFNFWKMAAFSILILLMIQVLLNIASAYYFKNRADRITDNSKNYYQSLFPNEEIKNFESQWSEKINGIQVGPVNNDFSHLFSEFISEVSKESSGPNGFSIRQFGFDEKDGELKININIGNIKALESIKARMGKKGIEMVIISANDEKDSIRASIIVKSL